MSSLFSVKDKTILITGASRGIGKSFALGFQKEGAIVYGTGSSEKSISWMKDSGLEGRVNNVLEEDSIKLIIEEIKQKHGKLDVLINNAGISMDKPASALSEKDMSDLIDVNFKAVFRASQAYYKTHKNLGGNIINIASVLGLRGFTLSSVYSGTKGAVIQMTKACASEWTRSNFRLNAICPGFIDTDMVSNMKAKEALMEGIKTKIPMGRMGKPEELLGTAIFLASNASSYITGQILVVDGGMTEIV
jgi:3-oxoacyl-[acyl-carrier protein] reductase